MLYFLELLKNLNEMSVTDPVDGKDQTPIPFAVGFFELPSPSAFSIGIGDCIHNQHFA